MSIDGCKMEICGQVVCEYFPLPYQLATYMEHFLGGVTNGNDLMAAYARSGKHWARPLAEMGLLLTDVGDRGQVYREGPTMFMLGAVWQIIKGWFVGAPKSKSKAV